MIFARFGETKAFRFNFTKPDGKFIKLQFLGYGNQEFVPVYVKVEVDNKSLKYYRISAEPSEDVVTVKVEEMKMEDTPSHLQSAKL